MTRIPRLAALAAPLLALAFIRGESAGDDASEELRKRFFENEAWYGQATASIQGSGSKGDAWSRTSYSIRREAVVEFRVKFNDQGLTGKQQEQAMELALKHAPPKDVDQLRKAFEEMRSQRMWITETSKRKPEDFDDVHLLVRDSFDSWGKEACGDPITYHDSKTASGQDGRKDECVDTLMIDLAKKTWKPRLDPKVDILTVTRTSSHSGGEAGSGNSGKGSVLPESATGLPSLLSEERALPGQAELSGSEPIPKNKLPLQVDYGTLEGTISWVISPVPFEDVELVLKPGDATPKDYDDWRPLPGADEKTAGNSIKVRAVLQKRGGGSPAKVKMTSLVVRLSDASREPGICINWPAKGGASSPDLMFEAARNAGAGVTVDGEGTRVRRKGGEFEDLLVEVSAFDGGAWGEVNAEARLTDGRTVFAILDGQPETHEVLLPKRARDSKIADIWKTNRNQSGKKDDVDDDAKPAGDGQTGDGLANYEEYRGFREKQVWKEGDPEKKDFFVRNEAGGVAEAGINLFEKISELEVHRLEPGELSPDRVVNFNQGRGAHIVDQHGVRIVNAPSFKGYCQAVSRRGTGPGTPKDFEFVGLGTVPTNAIDVVTNGVVTRSTYNAPTVAHELLHCCNVWHHGEEPAATSEGVLWTKESDGIYEGGRRIRVLDSGGADIAALVTFQRSWWRREKLVGWYAWQGTASGDVGCVMRYDTAQAYTPQGAPDDRVLLLRGEEPIGGGLCATDKATGTNLTPGRFGPCAAKRGNCKGQILVNDAKTAPRR